MEGISKEYLESKINELYECSDRGNDAIYGLSAGANIAILKALLAECKELPPPQWQTIEVEGLPEGYKVNSITVNAKENVSQCFNTVQATIHLKKIQPRRIVLDLTQHEYSFTKFKEEV